MPTSSDTAAVHKRSVRPENDSSRSPSPIERMEDTDRSFSQNSLVEIYDALSKSKEKGKAVALSSASAMVPKAFDENGDHPLMSPMTKKHFKPQTIPAANNIQSWYTALDIYSPALPGNCLVILGRIFVYLRDNVV